jgi:hypothetical protein
MNNEKFIKKSELSRLVEEIIKQLVKEIQVEEDSVVANASPVTGPQAFAKKKTSMGEEQLDEMTTTMGGTPGYNVPGAFSRRGGSKAGVAGSAALGYELTPTGRKDMEMPADKLYEKKK